ncbi:hypothetical protein ACK4CT_17800 [Mycolicibacterium nivoides]|uniref:ApeA N-terminal domain-containing protein n=1 Tax=Mycolicibacterium nivoides TaxID=2487344 RepID=A0ABW9LDZ8_9MYCO
MSTNDFHELTDRLGRVHDADSGDQMGMGRLTASPKQIVLEYLPDKEPRQSALMSIPPREIPERLVFVDSRGVVGLDGCGIRRATRRGNQPSLVEVHADHSIQLERPTADFAAINSVRSEIAGLATWVTQQSVVEKTMYSNDDDLITRVVFEAKAGEPNEVGADHGLRFVPYFDTTSERSLSGGRHEIVEKMFVETRVEDAIGLDDHLKTHRNIQELLVIAYGEPCGQRLSWVASSANPSERIIPRTGSGDLWRGVISTWCGRGDADAPMEVPRKHTLFDYPDIGADGVKRWVEESAEWARVVGPLVLWHFDAGSSVEVELLQIGVALEALGYKIALRQRLIQPGGSQSFPQYLKRIGETLNCDVGPVIKGSPDNGVPAHADYEAWSEDFGLLYRQAKHADHPLPNGLHAVIAARSGARLLRMWLAVEFGVDHRTVNEFAKYA